MVLPVSMDATWLDGSVQFNGQELRRADAALFGGNDTAFSVRGGIVRHTDTSLAVTVNASDLITVQPGAVVVPGNSGLGNGCYRTALPAADTGQLAARNATNPRIDLVIYRVLDTSVVGSHAAYTGRIEVLTGTPGASPAVPSLPALAVELARVTVPATGGGVATVDSSFRQYASAIGAPLFVPSSARLPASAAKWQQAIALDTGFTWVWTGSAWQLEGAPATYSPALGNIGLGNGTNTGEWWISNRTVHFWTKFTMGSTSVMNGAPTVGLPIARVGEFSSLQVQYNDAGIAAYAGNAEASGASAVALYGTSASGGFTAVSPTLPFTWGTGDTVQVRGSYHI